MTPDHPRDDDLVRDDDLARHLREALRSVRAPRAWVEAALQIPERTPPLPEGRRREWLLVLAPHLAGLALLLGFAAALLLRSQALAPAGAITAEVVHAIALRGPDSTPWGSYLLLSFCFLLLLDQGARGFPLLKRLRIVL